MAGDWIKMRSALRSSPKVVRIASALKADKRPDTLRVVGALHAVWSLADEHSEDGRLDGYTLESLDDAIGWPGLGAAMQSVQWLNETAQGLEFPRFDEHNGASAKRRAMESERKRRDRTSSGQTSASNADKKRTREEKRREEKPSRASRLNGSEGTFAQFWAAYPIRKSKATAEKAWAKIHPDEQLHNRILDAIERAKTSADWRKENGRFIPYPATWLNAAGWEDELPQPQQRGLVV